MFNSNANIEPVTVTIPVAVQISGLGRTKLYELLGQKKIKSITVGRRRLVFYASLKSFLTATLDRSGPNSGEET